MSIILGATPQTTPPKFYSGNSAPKPKKTSFLSMKQFTIASLVAHLATLGIAKSIEPEWFGLINPTELGELSLDSKKRYHFNVLGYKIAIANGANPMELKGELGQVNLQNPKWITDTNKEGKFSFIVVR